MVFLPKNTLSDTFHSWNFGVGDGSVGFVECKTLYSIESHDMV